ncbi:hypothetical protein, partial [Streptomyces rimosus]|uniref:hypothetical protein n=1 Tax=Streptomyces rimosus TaxID=1927 RepID=UPI000B300860
MTHDGPMGEGEGAGDWGKLPGGAPGAEALWDSAFSVRVPLSMSGVLTILSTPALVRGSVQPVCQM